MSAFSRVRISLPLTSRTHRHRRAIRCGVAVHEIVAGVGEEHFVGGVLGRQQRWNPAVHVHLVEMREVRVATLLAADRLDEQQPALLVDAQQLRDVAFAAGDLALQLAGLEVVEIELAPVVALGEPDHFVRRRQVAPVDRARCPTRRTSRRFPRARRGPLPVAGSATRSVVFLWSRDVETNATLFESGAHCTSAQSPPRHDEVVAERRAMLVGLHLEAHHLRRRPRR